MLFELIEHIYCINVNLMEFMGKTFLKKGFPKPLSKNFIRNR